MLRSIYLSIFFVTLLISVTGYSNSFSKPALDEALSAMQKLDPEISEVDALERIIESMSIYFDMKDADKLNIWTSARTICKKGIEEDKLFKCAAASIIFQDVYGTFFSSDQNVTTNPDKFDNAHFTGAIVLLEHYYKKMKPSLQDSIPILAQIVMAKEKGWSGMNYAESDSDNGNICSTKGLANHFSGTPGGGVTDPMPGNTSASFSGGYSNPMSGPDTAELNQATMKADIATCPLNLMAMGGGAGDSVDGDPTSDADDPSSPDIGEAKPATPTPIPESPDTPDSSSVDFGDLSQPSPLEKYNSNLKAGDIIDNARTFGDVKLSGGPGYGISIKINFSPRPNGPDFYSACASSGALSFIASCSGSSSDNNNACGTPGNSLVSMPSTNGVGDNCGGDAGYFMDNTTPIVNWGPDGPPTNGGNGGAPSDPCAPNPVSGMPKNPQACCASNPSTPGCGPSPWGIGKGTFPRS